MAALELDGASLTIDTLMAAATGRPTFSLAASGLARMVASRALLDRAVADRVAIYGVTTGLGSRATQALGAEELASFAVDTIRGRAHAVGPLEADATVRAAMIVRLNTLLTGHPAASPAFALHLLACLNAGVTPLVPSIGSTGVGDLMWNGSMALALLGDGPMRRPDGSTGPGDRVMAEAGIAPWHPGPRDGLAAVASSTAAAAAGAGALFAASRAFEAAQTAAALSLEAFQFNVTPFLPRILACNPHPDHAAAAAGICQRLAGSTLLDPARARRLQDPLSLRNVPQIHGTALSALRFARATFEIEINGASDNPVALPASGEILSTGAYFAAHLTNALETVARAFVHLAVAQVARMVKLLVPELSGLPAYLVVPPATTSGLGPMMKTAEAVLAELVHTAQPVPIWPSLGAQGVEDCLTNAPLAARALQRVAELCFHLSALEMITAAQALDLRADAAPGAFLARVQAEVRAHSPLQTASRPLGTEIAALTARVAAGAFGAPGA